MIPVTFLLLFLLCLPALAQGQDRPRDWNAMLAAAKKEGKLVITGSRDPVTRRELPKRFSGKFGIPVEYIGARSSETAAKLRLERRAGLYSMDVFLSGIGTASTILYPEKMLDPLRPHLILPEVVDPSKWKRGELWFMDPKKQYVLRLLNGLTVLFHINTEQVNPNDLKSLKDLLSPKWKGKIAAADPSAKGASSTTLVFPHGMEFAKKLFLDQKPIFTRSRRQLADWVARGTYPIALGASSREVRRLQREGFPVKGIFRLSDALGMLSIGNGAVGILNRAPHPSAARVFVNWLATQEGLEFYSRIVARATTRNDVDESFLPAEEVPRSGREYFDASSWDFATREKEEFRLRLRKLLRSR